MLFRVLADLVVLLHFGFIVFALLGALLALRWPRVLWVHAPAVIWGVAIEAIGFVCPLTPLENLLRVSAGQAGYTGGFVDHYILPVVYPAGLTRSIQILLAIAVLVEGVCSNTIHPRYIPALRSLVARHID